MKTIFFLIITFITQCIEASTIDSLFISLRNEKSKNTKAFLYNEISKYYLKANYDSAIFYGNKATELITKGNNPQEYSRAIYYIGLAYKSKYKPDSAKVYFEKSLKIRELFNQ